MKTVQLKSVISELNLKVITGDKYSERDVSGAYVSDLLSDVIGNAKRNDIWISMQSHINVVAVASLRELAAIIITGKGTVDDKTIEKAKEEEVIILKASEPTFETTGELYEILKEN